MGKEDISRVWNIVFDRFYDDYDDFIFIQVNNQDSLSQQPEDYWPYLVWVLSFSSGRGISTHIGRESQLALHKEQTKAENVPCPIWESLVNVIKSTENGRNHTCKIQERTVDDDTQDVSLGRIHTLRKAVSPSPFVMQCFLSVISERDPSYLHH